MIEGVKILQGRAWEGRGKSLRLKKSAARPRSGQKRAGKKEGVLGEGIFARPPILAEFLPRRRHGNRSISFKIGSDLVV